MAVLKVDDVGKTIQLDANFDLSGNTALSLVFTKPDQTTTVTVTSVTAPAVAGESALANQYWQYLTESGLLDTAGEWQVHGEYVDATPKDFAGDTVIFTVDERTITD